MRQWRDVATLVKPKNLNGRFVARPAAGLPFVLNEGVAVAFVPPQLDIPRQGVVVFAREIDGSTWEVGFDTVSDGATAKALAGCHCLVKRDLLAEMTVEDEPLLWIGWHVLDVDGQSIGEVVDLVENPAHPLLEVERADGAGRASIPVVDAFIVGVDEHAREVTVSVPDGLLDL